MTNMIITDFIILCIEQKHITIPIIENIGIEVCKNKHQCRFANWQFMQSIKGFLYDIMPISRKNNIYNMEKEFFDIDFTFGKKHFIKTNLDIETIKFIIDFFLKQSPIKTIVVLLRLQGIEKEKIKVFYNKETFIKNFINGKLTFNTEYIIIDRN